MKVISLNVNGIRAASRKGFYEWLSTQDADFVCLQEIKAHTNALTPRELFYPQDFFCEYYDAHKKGYSGVAIYARKPPEAIYKGLGFADCDTEGRYLQFDYSKITIVSLYMPSGTSGDARQTVKYNFLEKFAEHLAKLKSNGREVILCGDFNIAHREIDLKNWRANQKHSGFLPQERSWMDVLFGQFGFIDAFRLLNQNAEQYTWWSHRGRAWDKNVGWRIDYQIITPGLASSVAAVDIYKDTRFSDHAPLLINYLGDWGV